MEFDNPQARSYLAELFKVTGTNLDSEASMYDVGAALGLEKNEAGALAEELIIEGWVGLKSLSGGIGISAEGLSILDVKGTEPGGVVLRLDNDLILGEDARAVLESVIEEIKEEISKESDEFRFPCDEYQL